MSFFKRLSSLQSSQINCSYPNNPFYLHKPLFGIENVTPNEGHFDHLNFLDRNPHIASTQMLNQSNRLKFSSEKESFEFATNFARCWSAIGEALKTLNQPLTFSSSTTTPLENSISQKSLLPMQPTLSPLTNTLFTGYNSSNEYQSQSVFNFSVKYQKQFFMNEHQLRFEITNIFYHQNIRDSIFFEIF